MAATEKLHQQQISQPSGPLYNHLSPSSIRNVSRKTSASSSSLGVSRPSLRYSPTPTHPHLILQTAVGSDSWCRRHLNLPSLQMPSYNVSAPRARAAEGGQGKMKRKRCKGTQGCSHHFRGMGRKIFHGCWIFPSLLLHPSFEWSISFYFHTHIGTKQIKINLLKSCHMCDHLCNHVYLFFR